MDEIRKSITSKDIAVLNQSLDFVRLRASLEAERGRNAETRATAMLAVLGLLAGLIVPLIESITKVTGDGKWFLFATFLASLLFLVKGLLYAIRVFGVSKRYRLKPETVYDFQPLSPEDSLREEIAASLWECNKVSQPNTEKLFWLHRCQRNGFIAILFFIVFGLSRIAIYEQWIAPTTGVGIIVGLFFLLFAVMVDKIAERRGIWGPSEDVAA